VIQVIVLVLIIIAVLAVLAPLATCAIREFIDTLKDDSPHDRRRS
jgi:Tfp pilus assembly protein FimT